MPDFNNLGDLIRRDRDLSKVAIIGLGGERGPCSVSFAELDAMANGVARALIKRGLRRGERVALLSPTAPNIWRRITASCVPA